MSDKDYSFSKKFVEGEAVSGFWSIVFQASTMLNSLIIVAILSVHNYGLYQLVLSVSAIAFSLTAGIFDDLVVTDLSRYLNGKEIGTAKKLFKEYAVLKIGLGVLLMALILIGAEGISKYYDSNIAVFLRIVSIAFLIQILQSVVNIFFKGAVYFRALGADTVGEVAKFLLLIIIFFWRGVGILEVLIAYTAGQFFELVFSGFHFLRLYRKIIAGAKAIPNFLLKDLFRHYGIWIVFRYALSRIANNIRPWVIQFFLNTEAVGLFSFARNIIAMILRLMPLGTLGLLLPRELENKDRLRFIFTRVIKYSFFLSILLSLFAFFVTPFLIKIFFPKYSQAIPLFLVMTISIILYAFYKIFRMVLIAFKNQKALFMRSFDNSILAPLTLFILLPLLGVMGTAVEWVTTYAITTVLFYLYIVKEHPYLVLKLRNFFTIDKYDKELIAKALRIGLDFLKTRLGRKV